MKKVEVSSYNTLVNSISKILEEGRRKAYFSVNTILVRTYWEIGKQIVEFEQNGEEKAEYGSSLLRNICNDLSLRFGSGFSKSNVYLMRVFYLKYPKFQTVSGKLSWSHYVELISLEDTYEQSFYEKQCLLENWSIRELKRQINSALFQRLVLSKDKKTVLKIAKRGQIIEKQEDIIKEPFVLEFLGIRENYKFSEKELEQKIIDNLQMFILELGKGFTFVARQYRITLDNNHFYTDLVFYHRILKCFVLFDLKVGKITPQDIGQMNMYLNYFKEEETSPGDNPPIGIILSTDKNDSIIRYALGGITNKLFVSKYKLYLPDKKQLKEQVEKVIKLR